MTDRNLAERNIHFLSAIEPELPARLQAFLKSRRESSQSARFEFVPGSDESVLCRSAEAPDIPWIHGPGNPPRQARDWIESYSTGNEELLVVWQAGLGYVPRILAEQRPQTRIAICESRFEIFWEWLCTWDFDESFGLQQFYLIIDERPEEELKRLGEVHPSLFRESFAVIPGSNLNPEDTARMKAVSSLLQDSAVPERPVSSESKTFLLMPSSLEDMVPAVMRGAESNGYRAIHRTRSPGIRRFLAGRNLWRETCGCVPEIALGFYGSIFSTEELISMGEAGVKRVIWYYDNPRDRLRERLGECYDLALVFDPSHLETLRPVFGSRVRTIPLATGFDEFTPSGRTPPSPTPVTYIGATGLRPYLPMLQSNPPLANAILQAVRSAVSETLGGDAFVLQKRLLETASQFTQIDRSQLIPLLYQLATVDIRIRFLNTALPHGLTIYGDALWGQRAYAGQLTQAYAGTSLDYRAETPEVYAATPINLRICHPQLADSVPFRVYDVLACGGFLLTEYRPALEKQFTIGRDLDAFRTPEELSEKIAYYLEHKPLRKDIATQGQQTVLQNHTYKHRINEIIQMLDE